MTTVEISVTDKFRYSLFQSGMDWSASAQILFHGFQITTSGSGKLGNI
jgi:hypothetical protein